MRGRLSQISARPAKILVNSMPKFYTLIQRLNPNLDLDTKAFIRKRITKQ